jgi:hypothetical protein
LYLLSSGIEVDAIAHMKAEAEFRPPPHKRMIDDSQTSCRGNIFGNAPRRKISMSTPHQTHKIFLETQEKGDLQTAKISQREPATPSRAKAIIFRRP